MAPTAMNACVHQGCVALKRRVAPGCAQRAQPKLCSGQQRRGVVARAADDSQWVFSKALVRDVAPTFDNAICKYPPEEPISVERAVEQHDLYIRRLQEAGVEVLKVAADKKCPDCVFIEDTAVVVTGVGAVIAWPGMRTRRREVGPVREALDSLGLKLFDVQKPGVVDGGDVLRINTDMFVGISKRTNAQALEYISAALSPYGIRVYGIPVPEALHLKSLCTALDSETLVVAKGPGAGVKRSINLMAIDDLLAVDYSFVEVRHPLSANVVRINKHVLIQPADDEDREILVRACAARGLTPVEVDMSETGKADGALTCCSILIP
ncbi:unnamed protein product [Pedinophyceae sp. YPF-701]|nr:unnamed protein product [Pedinophyceae sp. YPF-701]